jgi:hypothetical protein
VAAIAEAQTLAAVDLASPALRELVRHARELHDLLVEQLDAAELGTNEYARGLVESIGNHLDELEAALRHELN